jgi:hypothetical protein
LSRKKKKLAADCSFKTGACSVKLSALGSILQQRRTENVTVFWQNFLFSVSPNIVFKLRPYKKFNEKNYRNLAS